MFSVLGVIADSHSLKAGMLVTAAFPIAGAIILLVTARFFKKNKAASD